MKLAIRIFAMLVVFAGLTAASVTSAPAPSATNHLAVGASGPAPTMPFPPCPTCQIVGAQHK